MTCLGEIIKQKILAAGPVSFRDFMEMALYYPQFGYYNTQCDKIGRKGDFYTSPLVSPVFGIMIARQLLQMAKHLNLESFTIVECGAGTGLLCSQVIEELNKSDLRFKYYVLDCSETMLQKAKLLLNDRVEYCRSLNEIPQIEGCFISNELIDNFPVHKVVMQEQLMEIFVDYKDGFKEIQVPASDSLKNYFEALEVRLPKGYSTEINLDAIQWVNRVSKCLQKGYVLTIDYGHPSWDLYNPERNGGTLKCINKHKLSYSPYEFIGQQDITSHVNFSALCLWGAMNGLDYAGYVTQGDFLEALGFLDYMKFKRQEEKRFMQYETDAFLTHLLLNDMGNKFKVLIQHKGISAKLLSGLKSLS
ncbi:MAG: SAM-dependent methyltransferase [Bacteroidia bacterium]|nr:SAM-dependent methyltransferase [Bacteroidia bacterium]